MNAFNEKMVENVRAPLVRAGALTATVEFARREPGTVLIIVLGLHLFFWTIIPILICPNLQLDLVDDLAPGKEILFAATGVTEGNLLRGVRFFGDGVRTHSLIMSADSGKVRFVDSIHVEKRAKGYLRLF